ncbi:MAG: OmpH family outer membrane protein [Planctomycetota bacterium]
MRIWSLFAAAVLGMCVSSVVAQEGAANNSQIIVAVVDVGYILKNHPTMKADLDRIEGQMKAADEEMTRKRDEILKLMEQLRERYQEGTAEYIKEEKRIAEMDTEFRLEIVRKRKEFDKSRAKVLYQIYSEIKNLVAFASDKMGIQVVMRVNGTREELDPGKPETVQLLMSQEVIHFAKNVDITEWVLDGLKRASASRGGAAVNR